MPYILNRRPKPKPPQNNVMTINKALKAVNDTMDWTVLFIVLLLVMAKRGTACPLSRFIINSHFIFSHVNIKQIIMVCYTIQFHEILCY